MKGKKKEKKRKKKVFEVAIFTQYVPRARQHKRKQESKTFLFPVHGTSI
jgi:hypothetical protein